MFAVYVVMNMIRQLATPMPVLLQALRLKNFRLTGFALPVASVKTSSKESDSAFCLEGFAGLLQTLFLIQDFGYFF